MLRSIQVTAGNAPCFGGGNLVHPEATLDDGLLYAYSVRPSSVLRLERAALAVLVPGNVRPVS